MHQADGPDGIGPGGVTAGGLAAWRADDARILDLRSTAEFESRHIPGSVSIPAGELDARTHELPPRQRPLLVVAATADEAAREVERLRRRGWLRSVALLAPATAGPGPWETGPSRRALWEATPIVRQWAARIPAGPVLDLGCGGGRDVVFLALRGHPAIAVDRLPDALERTARLAARHGVAVRTFRRDLRRETPPPAECADGTEQTGYAAVLMIRFLERGTFPWIARALRPGGLFLLETYIAAPADPGGAPAGGTPPARRLRPGEAREAFVAGSGPPAGWEIVEDLETRDASGESVARLVARRET